MTATPIQLANLQRNIRTIFPAGTAVGSNPINPVVVSDPIFWLRKMSSGAFVKASSLSGGTPALRIVIKCTTRDPSVAANLAQPEGWGPIIIINDTTAHYVPLPAIPAACFVFEVLADAGNPADTTIEMELSEFPG